MDHIISQLGLDMARQRESFARQWHAAEVRIITMPSEDIGWLQTKTTDSTLFLGQLYLSGHVQRQRIGTRRLSARTTGATHRLFFRRASRSPYEPGAQTGHLRPTEELSNVARVACRHPDAVPSLFPREVSGIEAVHADVNNDGSVTRALAGAWAVVNTVSLYVERGKDNFTRSTWKPLSASR